DHLGTSVVTEVDKQTEEILKQKLPSILPGSGFIGEETPVVVKDYNWIVDPIDGTLNYAHQVPVFACSIALWHHDQPVYALVSLPISAEIIHAIVGQGIYLKGHQVFLPKQNSQKPFITYSNVGNAQNQTQAFQAILQFTSSPRFYGSCVFHGAQIALGRINAGVFINQGLWDIAAIVLLAQEAGLTVKYLKTPPRLAMDNLKNYQYSLVIGPEKLTHDLAAKL
ncbi:MAG: inositol monophosphatase, partial [Patescibacteria group bacterium]|nr:inositol monophosphatase [Patescibacteria group bacterium]